MGLAFIYTAWGIMVWIIFVYGAPREPPFSPWATPDRLCPAG